MSAAEEYLPAQGGPASLHGQALAEIQRLREENLRLKNSEYVSALVCRRDAEIARLNREVRATLDRLEAAHQEIAAYAEAWQTICRAIYAYGNIDLRDDWDALEAERKAKAEGRRG